MEEPESTRYIPGRALNAAELRTLKWCAKDMRKTYMWLLNNESNDGLSKEVQRRIAAARDVVSHAAEFLETGRPKTIVFPSDP